MDDHDVLIKLTEQYGIGKAMMHFQVYILDKRIEDCKDEHMCKHLERMRSEVLFDIQEDKELDQYLGYYSEDDEDDIDDLKLTT